MLRSIRWILAAALALAATALHAAPRDGLDVRLSAAAPVLRGDVDVLVNVAVTNVTRHPIHVLSWQLPADEVEGALFNITRDGETVRYSGPIVKRAAPQDSDRVRIEPGATLNYSVELTAAYDLSRSGRYAIEYASRGAHGANGAAPKSDTLYLWLEGRSGTGAAKLAPVPGPAAVTYAGCSASQQSDLVLAAIGARNYADGAVTYLAGSPSATLRYTTWFGSFSAMGWNTAKTHFAAIKDAFDTKPLSFDCKCRKKNVYAFVYSNQPYTIHLCGAFWAAPVTGTDSRAGTLIHEMSHFDVVASTNDWAYGRPPPRPWPFPISPMPSTTPTATNISQRTHQPIREVIALTAAVVAMTAAASTAAATPPPLECKLSVPAQTAAGRPAPLRFALHNLGARPVQVLNWGTPFEGWFAPYVKVWRDDTELPYKGPSVKRGDPERDEYLRIAAGRSRAARVDLAQAFDLRPPGHYRVQAQITLHDVFDAAAGSPPRPRARHVAQVLACPELRFELKPPR